MTLASSPVLPCRRPMAPVRRCHSFRALITFNYQRHGSLLLRFSHISETQYNYPSCGKKSISRYTLKEWRLTHGAHWISKNAPTPEATRTTPMTRKEMTHSMVMSVNLSSVNVSAIACYHKTENFRRLCCQNRDHFYLRNHLQ